MKVLTVAGARPNFMKVAPILHELDRRAVESALVHTGQHYDDLMSGSFFRDLGIPEPDHHLGVGSGSHAAQTAAIMEAFEPVLISERPDWVVVVGDVNSTLACALVTAKLRVELGCRLAHVEAGLRSGNWRMPEEVNRVLTDRLADLLLTPSHDCRSNLAGEGIGDEQIRFVGNVMIDTLMARLATARSGDTLERLGLEKRGYALATVHRPANVDEPKTLRLVLEGLGSLAEHVPVFFPAHPRTEERIHEAGLDDLAKRLRIHPPVRYLDMVALMDGAGVVLTDSGGIQEETTALGVPCITLREQTERPITVSEGTNRLAPWPLSPRSIRELGLEALESSPGTLPRPEGWDGAAAERIVDALLEHDGSLVESRTPELAHVAGS